MIRFASLGSGSKGNALLVEAGNTRVLVDCGFSIKETCQRLDRLDIDPESLNGIVVTHEHGDHVRGVFALARRYRLTVWITHGALAAAGDKADPSCCRIIDSHEAFAVDGLHIQPFPVPHDAREPVQFIFGDGNVRLGLLTDLGHITPHVVAMLTGCDALILECNHDPKLLAASNYPLSLQRRIGGLYGHLSNGQALALLEALDCSRLKYLVAAHLSEQNNQPSLVRAMLKKVWDTTEKPAGSFAIAGQEDGFSWRILK